MMGCKWATAAVRTSCAYSSLSSGCWHRALASTAATSCHDVGASTSTPSGARAMRTLSRRPMRLQSLILQRNMGGRRCLADCLQRTRANRVLARGRLRMLLYWLLLWLMLLMLLLRLPPRWQRIWLMR